AFAGEVELGLGAEPLAFLGTDGGRLLPRREHPGQLPRPVRILVPIHAERHVNALLRDADARVLVTEAPLGDARLTLVLFPIRVVLETLLNDLWAVLPLDPNHALRATIRATGHVYGLDLDGPAPGFAPLLSWGGRGLNVVHGRRRLRRNRLGA